MVIIIKKYKKIKLKNYFFFKKKKKIENSKGVGVVRPRLGGDKWPRVDFLLGMT